MRRIRVIPTLLIDSNSGLVKTIKFGKRTYLGDPINAVKIFNEKEVDELLLLDIDATRDGREPNYSVIEDIVSEAFMPIGFGGGIRNVRQMGSLFRSGIEKVVLSSALHTHPGLVAEASARFGSQSIVGCLDVRKKLLGGYEIVNRIGKKATALSPVQMALQLQDHAIGEIIVYSVDRDGTYAGFDMNLLRSIATAVEVPVVACGGARGTKDFIDAVVLGKASAVAAGSLFVYQSETKGVLISYPKLEEMNHIFTAIDQAQP